MEYPTFRLYGKLVDASTQPVRGIKVSAITYPHRQYINTDQGLTVIRGTSAYTDREGRFSLKLTCRTVTGQSSNLIYKVYADHWQGFRAFTFQAPLSYVELDVADVMPADPNPIDFVDAAQLRGEIAAAIAALVGDAPAGLRTLSEISDALGDDPYFAQTLNDKISTAQKGIAYGVTPLEYNLKISEQYIPARLSDEAISQKIAAESGGGGGPGYDYYEEISFITPQLVWDYAHNQNTFALSVETLDSYGEQFFADVTWPDLNHVRVSFYYPTAGTLRLFT